MLHPLPFFATTLYALWILFTVLESDLFIYRCHYEFADLMNINANNHYNLTTPTLFFEFLLQS